jgi:hypothetical protein
MPKGWADSSRQQWHSESMEEAAERDLSFRTVENATRFTHKPTPTTRQRAIPSPRVEQARSAYCGYAGSMGQQWGLIATIPVLLADNQRARF